MRAEIGTDNRMDELEELSLQSVPVSLLAQLSVWPVDGPGDPSKLGASENYDAQISYFDSIWAFWKYLH